MFYCLNLDWWGNKAEWQHQRHALQVFFFQLLICRIPELVEVVSKVMRLEEGDLLLTGTPAGVGAVTSGQEMQIGLRSGNFEQKFSFHVE